MKLLNLPIEPLPERYSIDWHEWFESEFNRLCVNYETLAAPPLTHHISTGAFLDVFGTNYSKSRQMAKTVNHLYRNGDVDWIFLHDLWHPGVTNLAYVRDGAGLKFKIAGCLHAGTWDPHDFLSRKMKMEWCRALEKSILSATDLIFVATNYHKEIICANFDNVESKIKVTGFPIYLKPSLVVAKDPKLIVFPHRLDPEKRPDLFAQFAADAEGHGFRCVRTRDVCKNKDQYYRLLDEATYAVSFAEQETWGIAMQEAVFAGCTPIVPDHLSYREMYPPIFKYVGASDAFKLFLSIRGDEFALQKALAATKDSFRLKGSVAIMAMVDAMRGYH